MVWVTTGPTPTAVVNGHALGNITFEDCISNSVNPMALTVIFDLTIAMLIFTFLPFPATGLIVFS